MTSDVDYRLWQLASDVRFWAVISSENLETRAKELNRVTHVMLTYICDPDLKWSWPFPTEKETGD